ncbi:hypothetical protein FisN_17Hh273 [Fistulifera solaris]|uniref:IBB domain-containing protein n=1 Tax=Fistulifera solaris TaxID=1519565 RepID=A0A1Z5JHU4_FISSO|nr:hypothetical protein FisN_17Hh273 [Fistulifera solaris]|eukprot:GAX13331.1 hypothetical protein FisN_17Hh273 [Fistulifera solaris]
MSDKIRRRFPVGDPRTSAEQYHQDMFQRRQTHTVSLRKERKEERLWRRRRQPPQSTSDRAVTVGELMQQYNLFLDNPHEVDKLKVLQTSMAVDSSSTHHFLQQLIDNPDLEARNRLLIASLQKVLEAKFGTMDAIGKASFNVLMDVTFSSLNAPKPSADDYYGMPALRWSDIVQEDELLMNLLVDWLQIPSANEESVGYVCIILGNLLHDSVKAIPFLMSAWGAIVKQLPFSSYLCATLIREDSTHLGASFLYDLTPGKLAILLRESSTAEDASFILEGLCRREEGAVQILCGSLKLIYTIVAALEESMNSSNTPVLVPLLRATRNMFRRSPHAKDLLSHPSFLPTVSRIMEQETELVSLEVASALFSWNGTHGNDEFGTVLVETLMPVLVRIITSSSASFPWKRDAAWAVCDSLHHEWSVEHHAVSPQAKGISVAWLSTQWTVPQSDFVRSLTDLLSSPDMEAVVSALQILDVLLRMVQTTQQIFESAGGVDRLDMICERGGEGSFSDFASVLAADLLDDLFEKDIEEDSIIAPSRGDNEFVFGVVEPQNAFDFGVGSQPGPGRGRGLTIPAWMQQSKR